MDSTGLRDDISLSVEACPLRRGMACSTCRLRKKKCDGVRPVCGPCVKAGRQDCEFSDEAQTSTYELERKVAALRTRLKSLRRTRYGTSPDPEEVGSDAEVSEPAQTPVLEGVGSFAVYGAGPSSRYVSKPSTSVHQPAMHESSSTRELSRDVITRLTDSFFSRHQPLWFLHPARYKAAAALPSGHPSRVHDALEGAVCLHGITSEEDIATLEADLYERTSSALGLGVPAPAQALYILQARVLLTSYTLRRGQFLAGQAHLTNATSIVLTFGLYKGSFSREPLSSDVSSSSAATMPLKDLSLARDEVEQGERISAFWTVYALERVWGTALGISPRIRSGDGGVAIETPWPLEMKQYEQMWADYVLHRKDTIRHYIVGTAPRHVGDEPSSLAMTAKAALLLEYVTLLKSDSTAETENAVAAMCTRITALAASIGDARAGELDRRAAFVLLRGTAMLLHSRDGDVQVEALQAVKDVILNTQAFHPTENEAPGFLGGALGVVLPIMCNILAFIRTSEGFADWSSAEIITALTAALTLLEEWSLQCSFVSIQLDRLRGYLAAMDLLPL